MIGHVLEIWRYLLNCQWTPAQLENANLGHMRWELGYCHSAQMYKKLEYPQSKG